MEWQSPVFPSNQNLVSILIATGQIGREGAANPRPCF